MFSVRLLRYKSTHSLEFIYFTVGGNCERKTRVNDRSQLEWQARIHAWPLTCSHEVHQDHEYAKFKLINT